MAVKQCPTEHQEQCAVVEWLQWRNITFFAVPNSNNMSNANRLQAMRMAVKLKKEGVRAGVSDLVIVGYDRILFVEMKRLYGGKEREEQEKFRTEVIALNHQAIVCKGAEAAIKAIESWLIHNRMGE